MNENLLRLAKRRERLIADAEAQRLVVAQSLDVWRKPLEMADQGLYVFRYITNHPMMAAGGGTALLSMLLPGSIGKWSRRGWLFSLIMRKLGHKFKI